MNKICTSIEQSKKLIELGIDVNSADMHWQYIEEDNGQLQWFCFPKDFSINQHNAVSAWSLAALLSLIKDKCGYFEFVYLKRTSDGRANPLEDVHRLSTDVYDVYKKEAVDTCYEMILKLYELNLL